MAHELDEISRILGSMESGMLSLGRRFDRLEKRMDDRDGTLVEIQRSAEEIDSTVRYLSDIVSNDLKPVTDDVKRWRQMGLGALGVIGLGGGALGAAILWLVNQIGLVKLP